MRVLVPLVLLAACDGPPPEVCREPGDAWSFRDRTRAWGLRGVAGTRMSAADLDGDGYPDLVVSEGEAFGRDDFEAGVRKHWVLMNRPADGGGRTFVDATVESGLFQPRQGDPTRIGAARMLHVFADVDGDGDLDAFGGQFYEASNTPSPPPDRSEILLNRGDGTFELAPRSDVFERDGYATTGASFSDVDRDGNVDLWVVGWYNPYGSLTAEQDRLYLGNGDGTFRDATVDLGLGMDGPPTRDGWIGLTAPRPGFGAAVCDLDGDGRDDLLAANYGRTLNQQWMQQADGTFVEVAQASGYAQDDDDDFSGNQFYRCWCEVNGCTPDPGAAAIGDCASSAGNWQPGWDDQPHRQGGNTFGTVCADLDDDGDMDLFNTEITHWWAGAASDRSQILVNDGTGTFTRPGLEATGMLRDYGGGAWDEGDLFGAAADLDNDGDKDLLVAQTDYPGTRMYAWRHDEGLAFTEVAQDARLDHPWPAGLVVVDVDLDGDLDVITGSSTTRSGTPWDVHEVHLYENQLDGGNALRVRLAGAGGNTTGIGAVITATVGDRTFVHRVDGGTGHTAMQHDVVAHVGLGEACVVDDLTVAWPGGETRSYGAVRGNYTVTASEDGGVGYGPGF